MYLLNNTTNSSSTTKATTTTSIIISNTNTKTKLLSVKVTSLKHESSKVYSVNDNIFISEGTVTYTIPSGRKLDPIPLVSVYELESETCLIKNYRAYLDISPLFIAVGLSVVPDDNGNPTFAPR